MKKRWMILAGVIGLLAGGASAATVEERLAALEARFEQETSEREEKLLARIGALETQVKGLTQQLAAVQTAAPAGGTQMATRLTVLEDQVAFLEDDVASNPLKDIGLGGYGELHYNNLSGSGGASDKNEVDFHRFVLFFNKEFNDRVRFNSEIELEHSLSGDGKPGEVELEQAYVDFDLNSNHTARAGLFLLPIGLLNQTHEPPRFYGVERNPVEKNILPTTWWEAGAGLHGALSETLSYEAYAHSGLETTSADKYNIRKGRQKAAKAVASDPAATAALTWRIPGVTIGGSVNVQSDITQSSEDSVSAWMGEAHMDLQRGPWGLRALYAQWNLDGAGPRMVGADRQYGWYIEPSYRVTDKFGVFARYNQWDNQAGSGGSKSGKEQIDVGVNYWPHEQVVLKADYQWQSNEDGKDQSGLNLGVGYEF